MIRKNIRPGRPRPPEKSPPRVSALPRRKAPVLPHVLKCFDDCFKEACRGKCDLVSVEPFAALVYEEELAVKNDAVRRFWALNRLPGTPSKLIPARQPRKYRSNSKRRCLCRNGILHLVHPAQKKLLAKTPVLVLSELEPDTHAEIYRYLQEIFSRPEFRFSAPLLNYIVIRGTEKTALILNVRSFSGSLIRQMKRLTEALKANLPCVQSLFLYLDETQSDYYLEAKRPEEVRFKKLFGPDVLSIPLNKERKLLYPPVAFSQVNEAMVPLFLKNISELLQGARGKRLLDLYCGYGLIGLSMADDYALLEGMEIDGPAVESGVRNARFLFPGKKIHFVRQEISDRVIRDRLPEPEETLPEDVVLDPPRSGTSSKVIREIARREPNQVLHVFCGTDTIPDALAQWKAAGYLPDRMRFLDMFPGTAGIETLILLKKKS